ncbi:MAG TPA: GNAT family N-acetyltransferase [Acidimicrobiales bacterium]|jgi:ribosomal protein S18 acetylase RimI-like enzyme|nr:GNAT family N-acetyltransferase [Acidimicrobiales bacterium]
MTVPLGTLTTTGGGIVLEVTEDPAPEDTELLDVQVAASTTRAADQGEPRAVAVFARDDAGSVVGGIHGWTWGGCCELVSLWVDEAARGRGLGEALLSTAELEAVDRGCGQVVLLTHELQAPGLYRRRGYEVVGTVEGYPAGSAALWLRKRLPDPAGAG